MAEAQLKRQREDTHLTEISDFDSSKRQKLLSVLETEEELPTQQDISSIMSILENEISFDYDFDDDPPFTFSEKSAPDNQNTVFTSESDSTIVDESVATVKTDDVYEEVDKEEENVVIKHLLEASDDELGIPELENRTYGDDDDDDDDSLLINGRAEIFTGCDGLLWELEDETANYYTYMQSELFM